MAEINITYETLMDLTRQEKSRDELQELSGSFYADVLTYIQSKKQILSKESDTFETSGRDELANILDRMKKLYEYRERKILNMALDKSRTGADIVDEGRMLDEEKKLYEDICEILGRFRKGVLENLLKNEAPTIKEPKKPNNEDMLIRFLQPVPKFVGKELETYGPFAEDDMVKLPQEIARILVQKGRAEEMNS